MCAWGGACGPAWCRVIAISLSAVAHHMQSNNWGELHAGHNVTSMVCCVVELRRNRRRVSVTGLNRIHRHTSTGDTEFYGEQAQKPMCGSALVLARRGSVAGETVKSVRTHAFPMSVRTYAG